MEYVKADELEVRERRNPILKDVSDPIRKTFVGDVALTFDESDTLPKETMKSFFRIVQQTLYKKKCTGQYGHRHLVHAFQSCR